MVVCCGDEAPPEEDRRKVIFRAASEVGRPVLTAILTTVVSFLPIFVMIGAEGKLFKPLAFTKTFALLASVIVALTLIPPFAHLLFTIRLNRRWVRLSLAARSSTIRRTRSSLSERAREA